MLGPIGLDVDEKTGVIYHIYTDKPAKFPEERIKYAFDNRSFHIGNESPAEEIEQIGKYRSFKMSIPQEYNVTTIAVGFNKNGKVIWSDCFRVD